MTTALEIQNYLLSASPWVNPDETLDVVLAGDHAHTVHKAGVCWYPSMDTLRTVHGEDCELLICHESLFPDDPSTQGRCAPARQKEEFLSKTELIVLRVHDTWNQWPDIGIRDSWADFLGFTDRVYASEETLPHRYHAIYATPEQPLRALAQHVADRVKELGEDSVRVLGDPEQLICRPALGVGCACPGRESIEAGADVLIVCDDGAPYSTVCERLYEKGASLIIVSHGSCEMPGMENLCTQLQSTFPETVFEYFDEHPRTWTVHHQ